MTTICTMNTRCYWRIWEPGQTKRNKILDPTEQLSYFTFWSAIPLWVHYVKWNSIQFKNCHTFKNSTIRQSQLWLTDSCWVFKCVTIFKLNTVPFHVLRPVFNLETKTIVIVFAAWTMQFQIMMKEKPTNCMFKVNHIFKISTRLYKFWRFRSAIFREPKVILPKMCVCYVISVEYMKLGSGYRLVLTAFYSWQFCSDSNICDPVHCDGEAKDKDDSFDGGYVVSKIYL
jgi:hypothetical protein